ncbi:DUF726 domain-containing protein [Natrialbaceae archaeon A-CW3]
MSPRHTPSVSGRDRSVSRRTVLRGVGASAVGLGGLVLASSPAQAGKKDSCDDPPMWYPRVTTRGHFDTTWWGSVYITDGNDATNYDLAGDPIPGLDGSTPDELLIHAHGWNNDLEGGVCSVSEAGFTFDLEGYEHPVIGYTWDADYGWYNATSIAEQNGAKLAHFLIAYRAQNPGVTLRLCCHSLGARVVLSAIDTLAQWGHHDVVESATLLGGAADNDSPSLEGTYGSAIESTVGRLDNFWMNDDAVLDWAYTTAEWGTAIGASTIDGTPPANYADHNVDYVPDHFSHYKPDGCLHEVITTF